MSAGNSGIDLRALGYAALCVLPLFLGPFALDLLYPSRFDQLIVGGTLDLARGLTQALGITSVIVSVGVLSQWRRAEFWLTSYWRAIFVFAAILTLPYFAFFLFAAVRLGWNMLAPFQRRADIWLSALNLIVPLVTIFAAAWLYVRFRRQNTTQNEWPRFLFLAGAGFALSLPPFLHYLWQGIVSLTAGLSPEPGYVYTWFVSWFSTLIGSLFTGFGLAFLFGLPAIYLLKRWHTELNPVLSIAAMFVAAMGIWAVAHGLSLLSIWLTVEGHPRWDYWPTKEAVIVLALLAVGGVAAGLIYHRVLHRI